MNPNTRLWLVIGIVLLLLGVISSLMQETTGPPTQARDEFKATRQALAPEDLKSGGWGVQPEPKRHPRDAGFSVDPIRGISKEPEETGYFQ